MIKKYLEFIAENKRPGKDIEGSQKIDITGEELDLFSTEPQLQKLIRDEKVSVLSGEVWFSETDTRTKEVLDQYLEIDGRMNESVEDDFETNSINLKKSLKRLIEPLVDHESYLRSIDDKEGVSKIVDMLLDLIKKIFRHSMMENPNYELGEKETLIKKFIESVEESKKVFINKGFYQGIDYLVDDFTPKLIKFVEGEEEEVEEEEDLSKLGNNQINSLIDDALDRRDFKRVETLLKYLKESTQITKDVIEEVANDICTAFIDYIDGFLEIK